MISTYGPLLLEDTVHVASTFDLVHRDVWHADERIERGALVSAAAVPQSVLVFQTRGPQCDEFGSCVQLMRDMQVGPVHLLIWF